MTEKKRIEEYLRAMSRSLSGLPETDRADILKEIGAHLEHRDGEGKLDAAMKALGSPQDCARGFVEELKLQAAFADAGPGKTIGALFALASRRVTAAAGLFASGIFFLFAAAFGLCALAEIVSPEAVGLWVNPSKDIFVFGIVDSPDPATKELLGRWMIPVASSLSLFTLVIGHGLGRLFIRLLISRGRAGGLV